MQIASAIAYDVDLVSTSIVLEARRREVADLLRAVRELLNENV